MSLFEQNLRNTVVQGFSGTSSGEPRARHSVEFALPRASMPPADITERDLAPHDFTEPVHDDGTGRDSSSDLGLPSEGDIIGEHYRLVRLLGRGMFGRVYVAQRIDVPEHRVALKLLPKSLYAGRNVERELVMLATVGHPNVVQLKDHGTTDDYVWLTMPVYHGETLAERLERGPLDLREAHDIFLPIARGLDALHEAGLRHQDVKPENIYLAIFGGRVHPILLDLGVAAEKEAPFVAGTAMYAAPEQVAVLAGGHPWAMQLSEKMDTYCVATTLLMALVGPEHFPGERATDRAELSQAHEIRAREPLAHDALPELRGNARELIIARFQGWLALAPNDRPSMSDLADQLDSLLEPEREVARNEAQRRSRQKTTLLRFRIATGAMILIGLAGGAVMFMKRETLRVASELEAARKKGAESFDKLDTCIASHQMATQQIEACGAARERDQVEFKASLDEVSGKGSSTDADHARHLAGLNNRLKLCEETSAAGQRACTDDMARLSREMTRQHAALTLERDEQKVLADTRQAEIASTEKERNECRAERITCIEERNACQAAAGKPAPPAVIAGPRGPGVIAPAAAGTAPVASTVSPEAPVAPVPHPPADHPAAPPSPPTPAGPAPPPPDLPP